MAEVKAMDGPDYFADVERLDEIAKKFTGLPVELDAKARLATCRSPDTRGRWRPRRRKKQLDGGYPHARVRVRGESLIRAGFPPNLTKETVLLAYCSWKEPVIMT